MTALDVETAAGPNQLTECEQCTCSSADVRRDSSADDSHFRKWSDTENQTWAKHDVDPVRQPQYAHRNRGIAGASEDCVDHVEQNDCRVSSQHYSSKCRAMLNNPWGAAHELHQLRREWSAGSAEHDRNDQCQCDRLHRHDYG